MTSTGDDPDATNRRGRPPHHLWDDRWLEMRTEEVIDPERPIVDPHHHLWDRHTAYLVPQLLADLRSGHAVRGTVYIECSSMYRADGDPRFASVGEVEYANGIGAAFASGYHGDLRACAGIVGRVDLTMGALAGEVLASCLGRAPERFRGVRQMAAWDASPEVNTLMRPPPPDLLVDPRFLEGFATLAPLGLSFDAYGYHPQLPQVIALADRFPDTRIILDHMGGPVRIGPYAQDRDEQFAVWRRHIRALSERPNVLVKIGGLSMRYMGFDFIDRDRPPLSEELAQAWRPLVETCIEAFGPRRAMFESNFPVDRSGVSYRVLWNAFKRLAAACSDDEKTDLFAGTAIRAYRLPRSLGDRGRG